MNKFDQNEIVTNIYPCAATGSATGANTLKLLGRHLSAKHALTFSSSLSTKHEGKGARTHIYFKVYKDMHMVK